MWRTFTNRLKMKKYSLFLLFAALTSVYSGAVVASTGVQKTQKEAQPEKEKPRRCSFREKNCFGHESAVTRKLRRLR